MGCCVHWSHLVCFHLSDRVRPNAGSLLVQRLRRCSSSEPTLGKCVVLLQGYSVLGVPKSALCCDSLLSLGICHCVSAVAAAAAAASAAAAAAAAVVDSAASDPQGHDLSGINPCQTEVMFSYSSIRSKSSLSSPILYYWLTLSNNLSK